MQHANYTSRKYGPQGQGVGAEKLRELAAATKRKATIAVIDTGCLLTHEELKNYVLKDLAYNSYYNRPDPHMIDLENHGTGVASIIAGEKGNDIGGYGICPNTKVLPIAACNDEGTFDDESLVNALEYIEKLVKTKKVKNLHVINMSLGATYTDEEIEFFGYNTLQTDPLYTQIKHLYDTYGIVCVCAAGNEGEYECMNFPSDYSCCVSVAASLQEGYLAHYSNLNQYTDFMAPDDTVVASSESNLKVDLYGGTSYSAPVISSVISCLKQINPNLSIKQIIKILKQTATKIYPCSDTNYDGVIEDGSAGIINAEKAA